MDRIRYNGLPKLPYCSLLLRTKVAEKHSELVVLHKKEAN